MQDKLLQTPDGVRDTYDVECKKKRKVMHELHHILELYSYHDIETPTFEFLIYLTEIRVQHLPMRCTSSLTGTTILWCSGRI